MQITLVTQPFAALETDALVSYVIEETNPVQGRVAELDKAAAGLLQKLVKSGELTGKALEFTLVHAPAGLKAARLLLVGAGKREQWNGATLSESPLCQKFCASRSRGPRQRGVRPSRRRRRSHRQFRNRQIQDRQKKR